MKKILTIIAILVITSLQAQTSNDIYFIASTVSEGNGVTRGELPKRDLDMSPMIFIGISSDNKEFNIKFMHTNYNVTKLAKIRPVQPEDKQEIIEKPISFLETINPIDLNEMNYEWQTAEEAWDFGKSLSVNKMREQGKKIYFIDRADITDTTVKLIEIKYVGSNRPTPNIILD